MTKKSKPKASTPRSQKSSLYLDELSSLVETNEALTFLQKKLESLKKNLTTNELLACYHLAAFTLKDQLEKKEKEQKLLSENVKKLTFRLEEFNLPEKSLQPFPEKEKNDFELELKNLRDELKESQVELKQLLVDFTSYRDRIEKRMEEVIEGANEQLLLKLLPVLDNFERALVIQGTPDLESVLKGVRLINKQLEEVLQKEGLLSIESIGKSFDPKYHEAAESIPTDHFPEEAIIEEMRKGYRFKNKVIRPSLVKVAKAASAKETEENHPNG